MPQGGPITVGAVAVEIVPSAKNFLAKLVKEIGPDIARVAEVAGKAIGDRISDNVADGIKDGLKDGGKSAKSQGAKTGAEYSAAFVAQVKATLKAAEKALGDFTVHANMELDGAAEVVAEAKAVQAAVNKLGNIDIGVGMDAAEFFAEATAVEGMVRSLSQRAAKIGLDTSSLDKANDSAGRLSTNVDKSAKASKAAKVELSGLAAQLNKIAARASGAITMRVGLDADPVYAELVQIKAELDDIRVNVGVDLDDGEALARMAILEFRARELTRRRSMHIGVDRETASVSNILDNITDGFTRASRVAGEASNSTNNFVSTIQKMTPAARAANGAVVGLFIALPAIIAVANTAILGLLGLLSLVAVIAGAALLGIAVIALAFAKVGEAIKETEDAQKKASQTAAQAAQTAFNNQVALAAANRSVAGAEKALSRARASSARQVTQAARSLISAQRNLTRANEKEKDARAKLSEAYVDAKNDLAKLNQEIRKNRIEQEAANAALTKSREDLNALYADPTASQSDIDSALAEYHTREQALRDLQTEQRKNADEKAKYDKYGLDANDKVISAQAALKSAVESVRDAQDSLTSAAENSAQAQIDAANSVNDAEEALAQARLNRANTLKSQQLAAAVATSTQPGNPDSALAQLTEKGKQFVEFYEKNIKPTLDSFFKAAQDSGVLNGITQFFTAITPLLAPLKGLLSTVGYQAGLFFADIGKFLGSAEGVEFVSFLRQMVISLEPVMASLAKSGLKILFTLFKALAPVIERLAPAMATLFETFADAFVEFTKSDDFQRLLDELVKNAPTLLNLVVQLAFALIKLMVAIAPYTDQIIQLMIGVLEFINSIPIDTILTVVNILRVLGLIFLGLASIAFIAAAAIFALVVKVSAFLLTLVVNWLGGWDKIKKFFADAWDMIKKVFRGAKDWLLLRWHSLVDTVGGAWDGLFGEKGLVRTAFSGFIDWCKLAFKRCVDIVGAIWSGIKTAVALPIIGFIGFINDGVIAPLNLVGKVFGFSVDTIDVPKWAQDATGIKKAAFASGGIVPGYQSSKRDEVHATLRKGEGVLVPEVVKQIGPGTILEWNRKANLGQKLRHFAYGGLVDQIVAFERKSGVPFNVTSGVRNTNDYHGQGMAVDTASSATDMVRLASWLYGYSPYLLELIHSGGPGFFVKHGARKGRAFYGPATVAAHFNHVHTAMNQAGLNAVKNKVAPGDFTGGEDGADSTGLVSWALGKVNDVLKPLAEGFLNKYGDSPFVKFLGGVPATFLKKITGWLTEKASTLGSTVVNGVVTAVENVSGFIGSLFSDNKDEKGRYAHDKGIEASPYLAAGFAKSQLSKFGWDKGDMENLAKLWNGESGWRFNARNPSSGAYGIPQALPATKMASVGSDWGINAFTQVLWGMGYIKDRYGDPTNAFQQWMARSPHWYDTGGYLPPGLTLAYNGTGRHERVMTHDQEQAMLKEREMLLRGKADVNVYVHDGAVPGLVYAEVDKAFGSLADSYVYGGA